ncbi:MAG: putative CRISPR-associated protein [Planctomycetia bacterium]|nr:putative CRISPR-associated protein [Planctomycetia bacterium]
MNKLIISTCGTSVLTNGLRECQADFPRHGDHSLLKLTNRRESELSADEKAWMGTLRRLVEEKLEALWQTGNITGLKRSSAELNTILGYYGDRFPVSGGPDHHYFLGTDTCAGGMVAGIMRELFVRHGIAATSHVCEDLRTSSASDFRRGVTKLFRFLSMEIEGWKRSGYEIVFQLSGSFKSFQGFMQTLGMFSADEILYIFETSDELIRIPRIPIRLDDLFQRMSPDELSLVRLLLVRDVDSSQPEYERVCRLSRDIPLLFDEVKDDSSRMIGLSPWGALYWEREKRNLYTGRLLASPMPDRIEYGPGFSGSVERICGRESSRWYMLNERIDDFAAYLDSGKNPRRLDFKPYRGKGRLPSDHEIDAWAESPAHRIFLHRDGGSGRWILDCLDEGDH